MLYIAYALLLLVSGLFLGFVGAMIVATILDWNYQRKNRLWIELQRTRYEPRRPAAK